MTDSLPPNPDQQPSSDDLWRDLEGAEALHKEALEAEYEKIEGFNRLLLNRVAGLEKSKYTLADPSAGRDFGNPDSSNIELDTHGSTLFV